jgi:hypothetical protein
MMRFMTCAGLLLAGLVSVATAQAGYVASFDGSGITIGTNNPFDQNSFNNTTPASMLTPTTVSSTITLSPGAANGYVTGSLGTLRAYGYSFFPNSMVAGPAVAQTHGQVNVLDDATVVDPSAVAGTPEVLPFSLAVSGFVTHPQTPPYYDYEDAANAALTVSDLSDNKAIALNFSSNPASPSNLTGTLQSAVGDLLVLQYTLDVVTYVSGSLTDPAYEIAEAQYAHTLNVYATPGSGVSVVSTTGYVYGAPPAVAAVPEPAGLPLLAAGGLIFLGLRRLGPVRRRLGLDPV